MYHVIRGGCSTKHPSTFIMSRPEGLPNYVILIIQSYGEFHINNQSYQINPGTALILSPRTPYSYCNPQGTYMDDWLHFSIDDSTDFLPYQPIANLPIPLGSTENYTTLIHQILWEASYTLEPYASENMNHLFQVLMNHLMIRYQSKELLQHDYPYITELRALRLDIQTNTTDIPDIAQCAKQLGISESYFQYIYKQLFGISYQQDVIHFRIEHAKNMLLTTNLSMERISEICGYNNPVHFYRQFKKNTGLTPAKYRKSLY